MHFSEDVLYSVCVGKNSVCTMKIDGAVLLQVEVGYQNHS